MSNPTTLPHTFGLGLAKGATVRFLFAMLWAHATLSNFTVSFQRLSTDATAAKEGSIQKVRESSSPKCPMCATGVFLSGNPDMVVLGLSTPRHQSPLGHFSHRPAAPTPPHPSRNAHSRGFVLLSEKRTSIVIKKLVRTVSTSRRGARRSFGSVIPSVFHHTVQHGYQRSTPLHSQK